MNFPHSLECKTKNEFLVFLNQTKKSNNYFLMNYNDTS